MILYYFKFGDPSYLVHMSIENKMMRDALNLTKNIYNRQEKSSINYLLAISTIIGVTKMDRNKEDYKEYDNHLKNSIERIKRAKYLA